MLSILIFVTIIVIRIILSIDAHNYYSCKYNTNALYIVQEFIVVGILYLVYLCLG